MRRERTKLIPFPTNNDERRKKKSIFPGKTKKSKSRVVCGFYDGPDKRTKSVGVIRVSLLETITQQKEELKQNREMVVMMNWFKEKEVY